MRKCKKLITLLMVLTGTLVACDSRPGEPAEVVPEDKTYNVLLEDYEGEAVSGVTLSFTYENEVKGTAITDNIGRASIVLPARRYDITATGFNPGWHLDKEYACYPASGLIYMVATSSVITEEKATNKTYYYKGDIVHDFTVTDAFDETYKISELLEDKPVLILNFWALWCRWCMLELPYLDTAYQKYSEVCNFIALNPDDTMADIKKTQLTGKDGGEYAVKMAQCSALLEINYLLRGKPSYGIPVTCVINRYGCMFYYESGAYTSQAAASKFMSQICSPYLED